MRLLFCVDCQGNEVYGGGDESVGIFLHRSTDDAIVKGEEQGWRKLMQASLSYKNRITIFRLEYSQVWKHEV